tara:strand:- start:189 stop:341 length:153 start_codon:yes stop_codon:yes gene_type:complete
MKLRSGRIIYKEKMEDIEVANILLSLKNGKKLKAAIKKSILKQINIKIKK